ncbi:hypothetical protein Tco_0858041 [Tanacetum coccineum]|uniref:Uncharacterized protein n=1 Tax=Tanacetum coccineum TaxID=301880 RepID=A0ABQ5B9S2_9ASTR
MMVLCSSRAVARRAMDDIANLSDETEVPKYMRKCIDHLHVMICEMQAIEDHFFVFDSLECVKESKSVENNMLAALKDLIAQTEEAIRINEGHVEVMDEDINEWLLDEFGVRGIHSAKENDKGKGKAIIKELIIISDDEPSLDDDTSLDVFTFSNSDSSKESHDYMSGDLSENLINFMTGRDPEWQFPKQTQEQEPKPLDVPM